MSVRGRIPLIDKSVLTEILLKFKCDILLPGDKILSKTSVVWSQISEELDRKKSSQSLYTYVCLNKHGIRDLLNDRPGGPKEVAPDHKLHDESADVSTKENSFNSTIESDNAEETKSYVLSMSKHSFDQMVMDKIEKRRHVKRFIPGVWQKEISERLWNHTKLKCGFHFKYYHITTDLTSGSIAGETSAHNFLWLINMKLYNCYFFAKNSFIYRTM